MKTIYYQYGKRLCDVIFGVLLLVVVSWLLLVILILYLITFQFPIIFKQKRIGKNGVPFILYKFRTLSDNPGSLQERRFALGDFLRLTNADELPQLWNVLAGEMSLVGPRPMPMEYEGKFSAEQNRRHEVRPGITGTAQVYGKNSISWQQKFEYDLQYVRNITFCNDLKILLKTVTLVLSMKRDVSLMEEKFDRES